TAVIARVMIPARASGAIVAHSMKAMTTATEHTNTFPTRFERVTTSNAGCTSPGSGSEPGSAVGGGSSVNGDAVEGTDPTAVMLAGSHVEVFSYVIVVPVFTTASAGMSVRRGAVGWCSRLKNRPREQGRTKSRSAMSLYGWK